MSWQITNHLSLNKKKRIGYTVGRSYVISIVQISVSLAGIAWSPRVASFWWTHEYCTRKVNRSRWRRQHHSAAAADAVVAKQLTLQLSSLSRFKWVGTRLDVFELLQAVIIVITIIIAVLLVVVISTRLSNKPLFSRPFVFRRNTVAKRGTYWANSVSPSLSVCGSMCLFISL